MRTACAVAVFAALVVPSGCGPSESGARPQARAGTPATRPAASIDLHELDPASGIKGVIEFGDAPADAERAFGTPDRSEEGRWNGKPSVACAYDGLGLYLLFVEGGLERIMVTSDAFRLPVTEGGGGGVLGVGSTFREVDQGCGRGKWYVPGASGVHPFELRHNQTLAGRMYLTDGGCAYSFLASSPNRGNSEGGSDERVQVIVLALRM